MKILQINTVYKNGGSTGRIVYDLSQIIKSNGDQSFVAYGYEFVKTNDENTFKMENIPYLKYSILKTRIFGHHGFYNKSVTRKLLKWIDAIKPDLIHLHNLHNHYINVEMLFDYIKKHDIPIVWTLHDCWPFTGWCAYFDYAGCDKWKIGCGECPNLKEYPYTWFFDRSMTNYLDKKRVFTGVKNLTVVTPSQWLANIVKQSFLGKYETVVINNGINVETFKPIQSEFKEKMGLKDKKIVLAVASHFERRKGIDYLLKLPDLLPLDIVLVLVGVTDKQKSMLQANCIGISRTNNLDELVEIYNSADVFINPTLEDNFPTTNLEALACGTPVITFKTGGSAECINPVRGIVVTKGDIDGLVNAICNVLSNGDKFDLKLIADSAKIDYDKKLSGKKYYELYEKIYRRGSIGND